MIADPERRILSMEQKVVETALRWYRQEIAADTFLSPMTKAALWVDFLEALHTLYTDQR